MRLESTLALLVTVGSLAPVALAQDYGDRDSDSAVRDDAVASVQIVGFAGGSWRTLNADGHAPVAISSFIDPEFHSIGEMVVETTGETDVVEAAWWELILPTEHFVQFVFRTQEGNQFVPFNAKKNGQNIQAFTYEVGADGDGIDFRHWVDSVGLSELTISYSYDGGQTVFADPTIHDPLGDDPWSGTDDMHLGLAFPGEGVNWLQVTYKIGVVPAPATVALLAPVLMLRRRR
jgi:hypothetical protein